MRIAKLVKFNYQLLKFGIHLQVPDARVRVQEYIKRNNDRCEYYWFKGIHNLCIDAAALGRHAPRACKLQCDSDIWDEYDYIIT